MVDLSEQSCVVCRGGVDAMGAAQAVELMEKLGRYWVLNTACTTLTARLEFKGFAKAVFHANLAAWLGDKEGHHPDVRFGWGYCEVVFSTHVAAGLTMNDFICAAKFDAMMSI